MTNTVRRIIIGGVSLVAVVPLLFFASALAYPYVDDRLHSRTFDSDGWRREPTKDTSPWPTRLRMVDDLTARRRLIGMGRADVLELLGPADDIERFRETSRRLDDSDWDLGYRLGPERDKLMRIDDEWLLLDLDPRGRVQRLLVTHD